MLRIRSVDGKVTDLPESVRFVELASPDRKVGAVVFISDGGVVRILQPGDPDFAQYVNAYKVDVAKRIALPNLHFKTPA